MVYLKRLLQTSNKTNTTHLITTLQPCFKKQKSLRKELLSDYVFFLACAAVTGVGGSI